MTTAPATPFTWSDDLLMGNEEIDQEHQHLFEVANTIVTLEQPSEEQLKAIMLDLYNYVCQHFEHEKTFMEEIGYPKLPEHRETHQHIVQLLSAMLDESKDIAELHTQLKALIQRWIIEHVQQEDMKTKAWLLEHGDSPPQKSRSWPGTLFRRSH